MLVPITQQETGGEGCIGVASIGELEGFIDNNAIDETSQQRLSDGEKVEFSQCC